MCISTKLMDGPSFKIKSTILFFMNCYPLDMVIYINTFVVDFVGLEIRVFVVERLDEN